MTDSGDSCDLLTDGGDGCDKVTNGGDGFDKVRDVGDGFDKVTDVNLQESTYTSDRFAFSSIFGKMEMRKGTC